MIVNRDQRAAAIAPLTVEPDGGGTGVLCRWGDLCLGAGCHASECKDALEYGLGTARAGRRRLNELLTAWQRTVRRYAGTRQSHREARQNGKVDTDDSQCRRNEAEKAVYARNTGVTLHQSISLLYIHCSDYKDPRFEGRGPNRADV